MSKRVSSIDPLGRYRKAQDRYRLACIEQVAAAKELGEARAALRKWEQKMEKRDG